MFHELEQRNKAEFLLKVQIGIANPYRNQGIFRRLYSAMQKEHRIGNTHISTEVDARNRRSLAAFNHRF